MIDLILDNMEPSPMRVHRWCDAQRLLQPRIIAHREALKRDSSPLRELAHIILQGPTAKGTTARGAELERRCPRGILLRRRRAILECETVIRALDDGDVSQERADRVAVGIMQMIQLEDAEPIDRRECRLPRVRQHADQSSNRRREAVQRLNPEDSLRQGKNQTYSGVRVPHNAVVLLRAHAARGIRSNE